MDFNEALNANGFTIVPRWMAQAIDTHNPHMTVYLANSREYRLNPVLCSRPYMERINMEVN